MARNAIVKLGTDSRGNYQRDIGWEMKQSGKVGQHRFYFGTDQTQAQIRALNVLACWEAVERRCQKDKVPPGRPLWDKLTLAIAMSVAAGQQDFGLDLDVSGLVLFDENIGAATDTEQAATDLLSVERGLLTGKDVLAAAAALQDDFPMIRLHLDGELAETIRGGVKASAAVYRKLAEDRERLNQGPQALHQALDAFSAWLLETNKDHAGQPSEYALSCTRQVANLREHCADVPLTRFGLNQIEAMVTCWKNRPQTKAGRQCSIDHAKNCIKRIRQFVRWLHRSDFAWRKPEDYEVLPVRVPRSPAEKSRRINPSQVQTYSVDELATLYAYASPRVRLLLLLSLNCGFGRAELGSLQLSEVHLNQPHGHYPGLVGSYIKRLRFKSDVYGEWKLWPETEAALSWYLSHRPETTETALLVRRNGRALCARTKTGNRSGAIANEWTKLLDRVEVDQPGFRRLSYNKLRKTGADLVRQVAGGEIAAIYLCHGNSVQGDTLADLYSNRDFQKVFTALEVVREKLDPVIARVAVPFPAEAKRHNPSLPLSVRENIVKLRLEGKEYAEIASTCNVAVDTVRRYLKAAKMTRTYKRKLKEEVKG